MNRLEIDLPNLTVGQKLHIRTTDYQIDFSKQKLHLDVQKGGEKNSYNIAEKVKSQEQKSLFEMPISSNALILTLQSDFDLSLIEILEVDKSNVNKIVYPN